MTDVFASNGTTPSFHNGSLSDFPTYSFETIWEDGYHKLLQYFRGAEFCTVEVTDPRGPSSDIEGYKLVYLEAYNTRVEQLRVVHNIGGSLVWSLPKIVPYPGPLGSCLVMHAPDFQVTLKQASLKLEEAGLTRVWNQIRLANWPYKALQPPEEPYYIFRRASPTSEFFAAVVGASSGRVTTWPLPKPAAQGDETQPGIIFS